MTNLLTLPGIGKMAKQKLQQRGINTVEHLNTYILHHRDSALRDFVHHISLNPNRAECLEGYYPRKHNKRIKDGLIAKIKELKPTFNMNDYKTLRVPPHKFADQVIRCDTLGLGPYLPYDDSTSSQGTIEREGVAYRGIPGSGYRYGKSCLPSRHWSHAKRNTELRTNPVYRNRRRYKCSCFRTASTCNDMRSVRGNRLLKANGNPKEPYCKWYLNRCVPE
jgi:hypothetical protein